MAVVVVTGAAGFIGSCIVAKLNEIGREDLILVDHFDNERDPKHANLKNKKYLRYFDKQEFLKLIKADGIKDSIDGVLHMGACSSTVLQDEKYFEENNFQYSVEVAQWSLKKKARLIYASSAATYGNGQNGYSDDDSATKTCKPLNLYGASKQKFDQWVLDHNLQTQIVGLKFFNVFGPNEYHKGEMRSVVAKSYAGVAREGKIALFKSYRQEYADGEQKRDFIYVKDAVDIILFFIAHPQKNGILNVGTGQARTWKDLAAALFRAVGKKLDIQYIEMPEVLRGKYQYFTEARMEKLRQAGYSKPFTSLEDAIKDYAEYLKDHRYW